MPHRRQSTKLISKISPLTIILLAFAFQLYYLVELRNMFPSAFTTQPFCGVDAVVHVARAAGLLDGTMPGHKTFYFIPLYPFYLAVIKNFLGDSLLLPVFIQASLQLAGIAALYKIGRMIFSPLISALAALGMATYNYYLFYLPCFDQTLFTTPCLTLALYLFLLYDQRQKSRYLWFTGVVLAGTILSRPTVLMILPVLIIWLYVNLKQYQNKNTSLPTRSFFWLLVKRIIFLTLPFLVAVTPITWHNYRVSGHFILLSDNFTVNLYTGNNPEATGLDTLAHVQSQPAVLRFEEIRRQDGEAALTTAAWRFIRQQPLDWLALTLHKAWLWFGEVDERLVSPFFPLSARQSPLLAGLPLEWQATAVAALLGIGLVQFAARSRRLYLLWLVYGVLSAATILFFIQLRFRLPFAPFVILSAASLLGYASTLYQRHHRRFWAALIIMLILYPFIPGLWLFILLFTGLALWPTISRFTFSFRPFYLSSRLSLLPAVLTYLLIVGLWLQAEALAADVSQTIDHYLGPPLVATGVAGQTFQMDCNGLNRIDMTLGVFKDRPHNQPVTFYLATDTSAQEILFSQTFEGTSIKDYERKSFVFAPIPDSAGRSYFFYLASPTSTPDNALTARGYSDIPVDYYPAGSAWAGQLGSLRRIEADFAFTAFCDLSLEQKLKAVIESQLSR